MLIRFLVVLTICAGGYFVYYFIGASPVIKSEVIGERRIFSLTKDYVDKIYKIGFVTDVQDYKTKKIMQSLQRQEFLWLYL